MRSKAERACATTAAPSSVRFALSSTTPTADCVSDWISATSAAIEREAPWDSSASLRTSSATTAKPLPCSPARAASMAAFRASRLVCSAIEPIVSTIVPISADLASSARMTSPARGRGVADADHRVVGAEHRLGARGGDLAGPRRRRAPCRWPPAPSGRWPRSTSSTIPRIASIAPTWRVEPCATSSIAPAISLTARPVSSEVDAICVEAADTVVDAPATWAISSDSSWRVEL